MKLVTVELSLPYIRITDGVKARAIAQARLTPTQVVVLPGAWTIQSMRPGFPAPYAPRCVLRFDRRTKGSIPRGGSWRLERVFEEGTISLVEAIEKWHVPEVTSPPPERKE